jgi:hypothetical protein
MFVGVKVVWRWRSESCVSKVTLGPPVFITLLIMYKIQTRNIIIIILLFHKWSSCWRWESIKLPSANKGCLQSTESLLLHLLCKFIAASNKFIVTGRSININIPTPFKIITAWEDGKSSRSKGCKTFLELNILLDMSVFLALIINVENRNWTPKGIFTKPNAILACMNSMIKYYLLHFIQSILVWSHTRTMTRK